MKNFTAIDLQTSSKDTDGYLSEWFGSISRKRTTKEVNVLVQPDSIRSIYGSTEFLQRHSKCSTFDEVWQKIIPFIVNQNVVAHNGLVLIFRF
jgi:DNA polymerase-3 subunit epsilon